MTDTGAAEVQNYMYDEKDPLHYYVYPPQPAADPGYLELVYSAIPPPVILTWLPIESFFTFSADWSGMKQYLALPTITNDHLYYHSGSGFSTEKTGTTEPTWPTVSGQTVVDGDITWTEVDFDVPFPITLNDQYAMPILNYMLFKAFSVDANISPTSGQRATSHLQLYLSAIGAAEQAENIYDPNLQSPAKPSNRGV